MATSIAMRHKETGMTKDGLYGFSWTTLFFGFFPALFRGDFITFVGGFVITFLAAFATMGIGAFVIWIAWAFMYNKYYTRKLIERGYVFFASEAEIAQANAALGILNPPNNIQRNAE